MDKKINSNAYVLQTIEGRLELKSLLNPKIKALSVDFLAGPMGYRLSKGEGVRQNIAKAVGIKGQFRPKVWDVTAGLGFDGFILASLGCSVHLIERSPIIFALLQDGLKRAIHDPTLSHIVRDHITLTQGDAKSILQETSNASIEVIYLDPMFEERTKTALSKKEMRILRDVVGTDEDAEDLLTIALKKAKKRVVVKRSQNGITLPGPKPTHVIVGKRNRYDVYLLS